MRPYTTDDKKGMFRARDDIHHRTADCPRTGAKEVSKIARHGARQQAKVRIEAELSAITIESKD